MDPNLIRTPLLFKTFLVVHCKAELESNGNEVSPYFRPSHVNLSDIGLRIQTSQQVSFKHILAKIICDTDVCIG
jgi:hypothetical protein